ncbi:hypothetical protein BDQ17DRAFT_1546173 [Cyathus striatus]|nr:hypothetical protein BDQ17DRAFT_1546173 [Cyathus striatus]
MIHPQSYPPFPNIPTYSLPIIDYELLQRNDEKEIGRLWDAATTIGFWFLKNHGLDAEAQHMFDYAEEVLTLPTEEKVAFTKLPRLTETIPCYKPIGFLKDPSGKPDTIEFIHVSVDDALSWPKPVHRTYPEIVSSRMEGTITPYVRKAKQVNNTVLEVFNTKLGLVPGTLVEMHSNKESPSEARLLRCAARAETDVKEPEITLGRHTDFGSVTILHNILGGLQLQVPGSEEWQYVKPNPDYVIFSIGDTMAILSDGILHSGVHRVVTAPGDQAFLDRYSLVYFTRPGNDVVLRPLVKKKVEEPSKFDVGVTGIEWYLSRIRQFNNGNVKPLGQVVQGTA